MGNGETVGEYVNVDVGQLFGKIERRRAAVHKETGILLYEACRFLGDGNFFIRLRSDLFRVRLSRYFLYFFYGHCAAPNADDPSCLFQIEQVSSQRHLRNVGEIVVKLFQRKFAPFIQKLCDFFNSVLFHG